MTRFLLLLLGTLPSSALFAQGPFHLTCTAAKLNDDGSGFSATCKKRNGSLNQTSLTFRGLQNVDGNLTFTTGPTNYQQNCNTIRLRVPEGKSSGVPLVTAVCKTAAGKPNMTQLDITNIANIDGVLTQR